MSPKLKTTWTSIAIFDHFQQIFARLVCIHVRLMCRLELTSQDANDLLRIRQINSARDFGNNCTASVDVPPDSNT